MNRVMAYLNNKKLLRLLICGFLSHSNKIKREEKSDMLRWTQSKYASVALIIYLFSIFILLDILNYDHTGGLLGNYLN